MLQAIDGAQPQPADDRFDTITGRRSSIEWALATTLAEEPRVTVRRGTAITGLVAGSTAVAGVPHVAGVRLVDGEVVEDSGFTYIGRFFRSADGSTPAILAPILSPLGSISILCIPSDNGTWATTLYTASTDAPMRRLRDPDVFDRVVRELPLHAHWLDGEPISDVSSMSGVVDRTRRFVVDDVPVVTGMLSIADAHACTNPSIGRGMTLGLMHTVVMRDAVRTHIDSPVELAKAFDAATVAEIDPWHAATRDLDRTRIAMVEAAAEGHELELGPAEQIGAAMVAASRFDEQSARWFGEIQGCLAFPMDVVSREGVLDHVLTITAGLEPEPIPAPTRRRLLELVS